MQPTRFIEFLGFSLAAVAFFSSNTLYADDTAFGSYLRDKSAGIDRPIYANKEDNGFYLGIAAGASLSDMSDDRLLSYVDSSGNNHNFEFIGDRKYSPSVILGISGGCRFHLRDNFFLDLGFATYGFDSAVGKTSTKGKVLRIVTDGNVGNVSQYNGPQNLDHQLRSKMRYNPP